MFLIFYTSLKYFLSQVEYREVLSQMYIRRYIKYSLFLPDFNESLIFLTDFRILLKYQIS